MSVILHRCQTVKMKSSISAVINENNFSTLHKPKRKTRSAREKNRENQRVSRVELAFTLGVKEMSWVKAAGSSYISGNSVYLVLSNKSIDISL